MSKWITFKETHDTGKTKVWDIHALQNDELLGSVRWFGRWRQYCFYPSRATIWNADCLNDVTAFIKYQMELRKEK